MAGSARTIVRLAALVAAAFSALAVVACGSGGTTTVTTTAGATGATGATGRASAVSTTAAPTLAALRHKVLTTTDPALSNVNVLDCVEPRWTPVSEARACLHQVKQWQAELHQQGWPYRSCMPFYRDVCIPVADGDVDCPTVLHRYSNGRPVTVSRYSDPLRLDRNRNGIGCEPYP